MSLWLVRHALPLVGPGICYGRLDMAADAALTQTAAQALATALPLQARISASPRQRCLQLADALCALRPDLRYDTDPRLQEMDFGQWEGMPWQQIPKAQIDIWTQDFFNHAPGGGESVADVMQRVGQAWDDIQPQTLPVVWISHAGVARAAQLLARGLRTDIRADQWPVLAPDYGDWMILSG